MRKLIVGATVALLAMALVAPLASGDQPSEPRLDELHTKRPAAAALQHHQEALVAFYAAVEAAQVEAFLTAAAEAEARAAEAAAAARTPTTSSSGQPPGATGAAGDGSWMECTKRIESNGDYGAVSSGGTYRGAYQFHQDTWNRTASSSGRHDLVGTDPATASPADQDAMAVHLYDGGNGASHWGGRCT